MAGFTTVRDVGSTEYLDAGCAMQHRGVVPGPRMLVAVHAIGQRADIATTRDGAKAQLERRLVPKSAVINGADEARTRGALAHKYGATVIKTCATGGVLSLADAVDTPQLTQAELEALVDEAHALRLKTGSACARSRRSKAGHRAASNSIEPGSFLERGARPDEAEGHFTKCQR